jgi:hypothetical protein
VRPVRRAADLVVGNFSADPPDRRHAVAARLPTSPKRSTMATSDRSGRKDATTPAALPGPLLCIPEISAETKANVADELARVLAAQILRELREEG